MSSRNQRCDNKECGAPVKPDEGEYWVTGAYLCQKCHKQFSDNYDRVIKNALAMDGIEEQVKKVEDKKEEPKKKIVMQSKLF